jgi:hypothetical protein
MCATVSFAEAVSLTSIMIAYRRVMPEEPLQNQPEESQQLKMQILTPDAERRC